MKEERFMRYYVRTQIYFILKTSRIKLRDNKLGKILFTKYVICNISSNVNRSIPSEKDKFAKDISSQFIRES
jgi:hypothetical protein